MLQSELDISIYYFLFAIYYFRLFPCFVLSVVTSIFNLMGIIPYGLLDVKLKIGKVFNF
jgi:hypothetical protein